MYSMEKSNQSIQDVSKIMEEDLKRLKGVGIKALDDLDVQNYFFKRKQKHPEKYERLTFDTNSHKPYSKDVSEIINSFSTAGILYTKYYLIK
jgi:hypothetical protein